eukprot:4706696-Amphidinium_carterae.1
MVKLLHTSNPLRLVCFQRECLQTILYTAPLPTTDYRSSSGKAARAPSFDSGPGCRDHQSLLAGRAQLPQDLDVACSIHRASQPHPLIELFHLSRETFKFSPLQAVERVFSPPSAS